MKLPIPGSITQARANILGQGIQQTNRYAMLYPPISGDLLYPYNITLPGLGYDFIDHSIWSIQRKIPFRKTFTDVEVTFIVGNSNYKNMISWWSGLITSVRGGNNTSSSQQGQGQDLTEFAAQNGVSPSAVEQVGPPTSAAGDPFVAAGGVITEFLTSVTDPVTNNVEGFVKGSGGATNYMDEIYYDTLTIQLLNEQYDTPVARSTIMFEEAYVSQIAQVNLTSVETGYSPFKVFFKFANLITY